MLASAFIYIAAAPSEKSRLRPHLNLTATIRAASDAQSPASSAPADPSDAFYERVNYVEELEGNTAVVTPDSPYLSLLEDGGPIFGIEPYPAWDANDYPPALEVKLANTSREPILAAEVIVDVTSSHPDLEPIPVVLDDFNAHLALGFQNEGWGRGVPVEVRFALQPDGTRPAWGREPHRVRVPDGLEEETYIGLADAFRKEGVDVAYVHRLLVRESNQQSITPAMRRRLGTSLGRFKLDEHGQSRAVCFGRISYRLPNGRDRSVKFVTFVTLWGLGGIAPSPGAERAYAVRLDPSGRDYRRVVSIDEEVKPGQAIRFELPLLVRKSSTHEFTVRLVTANGLTLSSRPFRMSILSPRSRFFGVFRSKLRVEHDPA